MLVATERGSTQFAMRLYPESSFPAAKAGIKVSFSLEIPGVTILK